MIVYKNVLHKLKDAGYSTYRIKKEKLIAQATLTKIRNSEPISTATVDVICCLLNCQPGDILEYVPTDQD